MYNLLQSVFLPIVLAPIVYVIGRKIGSKVGWISFAVLGYSTFLILYSSLLRADYLETYPWEPIGVFGLRVDGLSLPFAFTIYLLSTVLAVYSIPYMSHRIEEDVNGLQGEEKKKTEAAKHGLYHGLYLIYASGMLGTVLATNLIQFYVFFELMLLPSYFLISEFGYGDRARISLMYFLWTHIGALVLLGGILATAFLSASYGHTSVTFDIIKVSANGEIVNNIVASSIPIDIARIIAVVITIGLFVKLAAFGLHIWLPYAHAEAPTPISALLSPAMIGIGGYAFIRILIFVLPSGYSYVYLGASIWGLVTIIYGGFMALMQDDLKRLLAYSSVSQMGYIIFGMTSAYYVGVSGSALQYVSHGTGKAILFMTAGIIILQAHGLRSISKMGGLAKKLPITATAAMLGFLTIMGVPPTNGFQSEWMIFFGSFAGAIGKGPPERLIIAIMALAGSSLTFGYSLWTMKRVFFGKLPENLEGVKEAPITVTGPLIFLAFVSLLLGIYPTLITDRLIPVLHTVLGG
jgi:NADH-quinone oxidoreductase subunit M